MHRSIPHPLMPFVVTTRRAHLRYMATSRPAISMSKELRQAAGRDPGLEWDPKAFRYRRRLTSDPHPSPASVGRVEGEGGGKVSDGHASRPAPALGIIANTQNGSR